MMKKPVWNRFSKAVTGRTVSLLLSLTLVAGMAAWSPAAVVRAEEILFMEEAPLPEDGTAGETEPVFFVEEEDAEAGLRNVEIPTGESGSAGEQDPVPSAGECVLTLDAGEEGFFTEENGDRTRAAAWIGIPGESLAALKDSLPVPQTGEGLVFLGWSTLPEQEAPDPGLSVWNAGSKEEDPAAFEEEDALVLTEGLVLYAVWAAESGDSGDGPVPAETLWNEDLVPEEEFPGGGLKAQDGPAADPASAAELPEDGPDTEDGAAQVFREDGSLNVPGAAGGLSEEVQIDAGEQEDPENPLPEVPETGILLSEEEETETAREDSRLSFGNRGLTDQQDPGTGRDSSGEDGETVRTVTFDANGGLFENGTGRVSETVAEGERLRLDDCEEPEKAGYAFRGWSTGKDESGLIRNNYYQVSGDVTLYAVWEQYKTVTFQACGGYWRSGGKKITTLKEAFEKGEKISLEEFEPDTAGSEEFKGWSLQEGGTLLASDSYTMQDNVTLYAVWRRDLEDADVELADESLVYNGKAREPAVTVTYDDKVLNKGTDYSVSYSNNTDVGNATVTITGTGKYEGTVKETFAITKAAQSLTLKAGASKIAVGKTTTVKASGMKEGPKLTWKTSNKKVAAVTQGGKVTAKKIGTVQITVTAAATKNYKSVSKKVTIKVLPGATTKLTATQQKKGFLLKWRKVAGATGYYIYRDGQKIASINKGSTVKYSDTKANTVGKKYTYKVVAKASTGASTLAGVVTVKRKKNADGATTESTKTTAAASFPPVTIRYCFEKKNVAVTLQKSGKGELAVIDMDGISKSVISEAKNRGVRIYGYLNAGALEKGRSYYKQFTGLCLAAYEGWEGEYWVDVTDSKWTDHLISEAKKMKAAGAEGIYLDNTDIYYMVQSGFKKKKSTMLRTAPSAAKVYKTLGNVIKKIQNSVGITVMPNGGDVFVRKFVSENPGVIKEVNQESVIYCDNKKQSASDIKYLTSYLDWCKKQGIYIRGIEYTNSAANAQTAAEYYKKHGWQDLYISRHKNLLGD